MNRMQGLMFDDVLWDPVVFAPFVLLVMLGRLKKRGPKLFGRRKYYEMWRIDLSQPWKPRLMTEPDWDDVNVKLVLLRDGVPVFKMKLRPQDVTAEGVKLEQNLLGMGRLSLTLTRGSAIELHNRTWGPVKALDVESMSGEK